MAKATKKKNPQDATLRNIRAQRKRLEKLEAVVRALVKLVKALEREHRKAQPRTFR